VNPAKFEFLERRLPHLRSGGGITGNNYLFSMLRAGRHLSRRGRDLAISRSVG